MTMESLEQLFSHELKDMYAEEQEIDSALQSMADCTTDEELHQVFTTHREETQEHIQRLEQVFDALGESAEAEGGQAIAGMVEEHDSFAGSEPTSQIHSEFDAGAAKKVERYEITAYEDLVRMADALELGDETVQNLQDNLNEEQRQFDRLKSFSQGQDLRQLRKQQT